VQPVDGSTAAPCIRRRGQPIALTAAQEVGRKVEEGAACIAHFRAGLGAEESCRDHCVIAHIEVPRAGQAHIDATVELQLPDGIILDFVISR